MRNEDNSNNGETIDLQIGRAISDGRLLSSTPVDEINRDELQDTTHLERILQLPYVDIVHKNF